MGKPEFCLARRKRGLLTLLGLASLVTALAWAAAAAEGSAPASTKAPPAGRQRPLYAFTLAQDGTPESYDESMAVACLQGIINRKAPEFYVLSRKNTRPQYWLDILSKEGRWLQGRELKPLPDLGALVQLAGKRLKGAVIWDPAVPACANVATTIAGVEDGVVLSPEYADRYLKQWQLI